MNKNHWLLTLYKIGRDKISRDVEIAEKTLPEAENRALRECRRHLRSRNLELTHQGNLEYVIYAGFRIVGSIKIISI